MSTKIAIIGMGHVGKMMYDLLIGHADIVAYDLLQGDGYPVTELAACDIGVVCVSTPASSDGSCDTSNVFDAVTKIPIEAILLKSTVPPGTTDSLIKQTGKSICYSPEYVGETSFHNSFWEDGVRGISFTIFGGEPAIRRRFIEFLLPILGPAKTYFQCTAKEAEIIKYMENAYLAMKVSFVAEFLHICSAFGADWHTVREGWLLDPRIGNSHTAVFPESPGFTGKCLPKDLQAIVHASTEAGYTPELLAEILRSNRRFRRDVM
jgi:nucleotide sugar dehydrogenase